MKPLACIACIFTAVLFTSSSFAQQVSKTKSKSPDPNSVVIQTVSPVDTAAVERITGVKGKYNNGEYKITIPQNDLDVEVDGFKIIPAMGLGTWIDFAPAPGGTMIMGDLILTETDLKPVQQEVIRQGLTITAIHNHFVRNHPNVMYMHVGGTGSTEALATRAKEIGRAHV